jgi:hypothetical protein
MVKKNKQSLYPTTDGPGPWHVWIKKQENKNIPIAEAKRRYLEEQLMFTEQYNSFANMANVVANFADSSQHTGGAAHANGIATVSMGPGLIMNAPVGFGGVFVYVRFLRPVKVNPAAASPTLTIGNTQAGGGSTSAPVCTYEDGSGTDLLSFRKLYIPGIPFAEQADFNAASFDLGNNDISDAVSGSSTLAGAATESSGSCVLVWNSGSASGSFDYGANVSASFTTNGGGDGVVDMNINTITSASALYYAGNTFTVTAAQLGKGGSGQLVFELTPDVILGRDTLSITAGSISGNIESRDGEGKVNLSYDAQSITNTVLPASASSFE